MLQTAMKYSTKALDAFILMLLSFAAQAQNKVEIDTQEVKSWFENNWIWIAGGVVLLLLVMLLSRRRGGQRKTTTVIKDPDGHVKSVTTTEEKI
jgi:flagellar biosynthesis/type III secretory pathway M-ring protein FliF/YscJ